MPRPAMINALYVKSFISPPCFLVKSLQILDYITTEKNDLSSEMIGVKP